MKVILLRDTYFSHSGNIQVATLNYKSLVENIFDGNTLKQTSLSPIQVAKNKKQYFQLFLNWKLALVFTPVFGIPNFLGEVHEICTALMHVLSKVIKISVKCLVPMLTFILQDHKIIHRCIKYFFALFCFHHSDFLLDKMLSVKILLIQED